MENIIFSIHNGVAYKSEKIRFNSESSLQRLIADNPSLIAENESDPAPYLAKREISMNTKADDSSSQALDILFVKRNAVPVLVEVKRSTDTRIRRNLIAQMIDYASRLKSIPISDLKADLMSHYTCCGEMSLLKSVIRNVSSCENMEWSYDSFAAELDSFDPSYGQIFASIYSFAKDLCLRPEFGKGALGSFHARLNGNSVFGISAWKKGSALQFNIELHRPSLLRICGSSEICDSFLYELLSSVGAGNLENVLSNQYIYIDLSSLADTSKMDHFKESVTKLLKYKTN